MMKDIITNIFKIIGSFPLSVKIVVVVLILSGTGGYYYIKALWEHQETELEILNKYATEKRSLEIALENCNR